MEQEAGRLFLSRPLTFLPRRPGSCTTPPSPTRFPDTVPTLRMSLSASSPSKPSRPPGSDILLCSPLYLVQARLLSLALLTFWAKGYPVVRAVLCIVGISAEASLTCLHWTPAPLSPTSPDVPMSRRGVTENHCCYSSPIKMLHHLPLSLSSRPYWYQDPNLHLKLTAQRPVFWAGLLFAQLLIHGQ